MVPTMKVFLSWSGDRSRQVAETLRVWLGDVLPFLRPWMSAEDIEKGARWANDLSEQLKDTHLGVICLTRENLQAPWILYEAGALSKAIETSRVCTYLLDLRPAELTGPWVQFQTTSATKDDTLRLLRTLNNALGESARTAEQLERTFARWWPDLESRLQAVAKARNNLISTESVRSDREILEEALDLLRVQSRQRGRGGSPPWASFAAQGPFIRSVDIRRFAKSVRLTGATNDANSAEWATTYGDFSRPQSPIDGTWRGRWSGGTAGDSWEYGTANVVTLDNLFGALYIGDDYLDAPFVIVAERGDEGYYLGRYYCLTEPKDNSPWAGVVVSERRIDGRWADGRWDFRR